MVLVCYPNSKGIPTRTKRVPGSAEMMRYMNSLNNWLAREVFRSIDTNTPALEHLASLALADTSTWISIPVQTGFIAPAPPGMTIVQPPQPPPSESSGSTSRSSRTGSRIGRSHRSEVQHVTREPDQPTAAIPAQTGPTEVHHYHHHHRTATPPPVAPTAQS